MRESFGPCDILINGAGGNRKDANTTNEIFRPEDGATGSDNLFRVKRTWLPQRIRFELHRHADTDASLCGRDAGTSGAVVLNISSMSAPSPMTKVPAYSATKAAINNFTQWLSVHLAESGIRVNAIAPGFFLTEQNRNLLTHPDGSLTERSHKIISHTPMRRFGVPEDLLGTLLWLVDDQTSGFVTER